jgi:hypothetical protein
MRQYVCRPGNSVKTHHAACGAHKERDDDGEASPSWNMPEHKVVKTIEANIICWSWMFLND